MGIKRLPKGERTAFRRSARSLSGAIARIALATVSPFLTLCRLFIGVATVGCLTLCAQTLPFRLADIRFDAQQRIEVSLPSSSNLYYVLFRGESVTAITNPISVSLGGAGNVTLRESS